MKAHMMKAAFVTAALLLSVSSAFAQATYTPEEYKTTMFKFEIGRDDGTWHTVQEDAAGVVVDLADASSFGDAFASASIPAGDYNKIRFTIDDTLVWTHAAAPVSLSNQNFTVVGGPPGPVAGQMTVYFATADQGGKPNGGEDSGEGTVAVPFLLSQGFSVAAGVTTQVTLVSYVTDTLQDDGMGGYDLQPPQFFIVADTGNTSALVGTYNFVFYSADKNLDPDGMGGFNVTNWDFESGYGTMTFAADGTWSANITESNEFDLLAENGAYGAPGAMTGRYGVSTNSFWMIVDGEPGTLKGAFANGVITAALIDYAEGSLMFFGVEQAAAATLAAIDGEYYFVTKINAFQSGPARMEYNGAYGVVTGDGSGAVTGTSNSNRVTINDPNGTPTSTGCTVGAPEVFTGAFSVAADGVMTLDDDAATLGVDETGELMGGILESGEAACISMSYPAAYSTENGFGFLISKSPDNTFTTADLIGKTYAGAFSGDMYEQAETDSHFFAGYFVITFTSGTQGTVTVDETTPQGLQRNSMTVNYTLNADGTIDFQDVASVDEDPITGALGGAGKYFLLYAKPQLSDLSASEQRFFGLGIRQ